MASVTVRVDVRTRRLWLVLPLLRAANHLRPPCLARWIAKAALQLLCVEWRLAPDGRWRHGGTLHLSREEHA